MKSRRVGGFEGVKELSQILDAFGVFASSLDVVGGTYKVVGRAKNGSPILPLGGHNEPPRLAGEDK